MLKSERRCGAKPFFSICIPQYNRTSFLLKTLESILSQDFASYEICISDGGSTDGRELEIVDWLEASMVEFVYQKQVNRCRYDQNLRAAIGLAQGTYIFLCGNDDALKDSKTFKTLNGIIKEAKDVGVVIGNYEDWQTGKKTWRIPRGGFMGSGPEVAATHFRNLSFVSGVLLDTALSQKCATDKWDGSEMYQMYIASRIVASGKKLLEIDESNIRKDIQVIGEAVDSYACQPKIRLKWSDKVNLPLLKLGPLVADAVEPYLEVGERSRIIESIWKQLYFFTYPFWIVEYRAVQSWGFSFNLVCQMSPSKFDTLKDLSLTQKFFLNSVFSIMSGIALLVPRHIFSASKKFFYIVAKKYN